MQPSIAYHAAPERLCTSTGALSVSRCLSLPSLFIQVSRQPATISGRPVPARSALTDRAHAVRLWIASYIYSATQSRCFATPVGRGLETSSYSFYHAPLHDRLCLSSPSPRSGLRALKTNNSQITSNATVPVATAIYASSNLLIEESAASPAQ
jgi:hypothetical protein